MRRATLFAGLVAGFSTFAFNAAQAVEIEYWQYVFDTRVKAMDELLTKKNVKHVWNESGGGHSWPNWQVYLSKYAPLLFRE